jgi:hypothetical protein
MQQIRLLVWYGAAFSTMSRVQPHCGDNEVSSCLQLATVMLCVPMPAWGGRSHRRRARTCTGWDPLHIRTARGAPGDPGVVGRPVQLLCVNICKSTLMMVTYRGRSHAVAVDIAYIGTVFVDITQAGIAVRQPFILSVYIKP